VHKQLQLSVGKLVYSVLLSCQHFATSSLIIGSSTRAYGFNRIW